MPPESRFAIDYVTRKHPSPITVLAVTPLPRAALRNWSNTNAFQSGVFPAAVRSRKEKGCYDTFGPHIIRQLHVFDWPKSPRGFLWKIKDVFFILTDNLIDLDMLSMSAISPVVEC